MERNPNANVSKNNIKNILKRYREIFSCIINIYYMTVMPNEVAETQGVGTSVGIGAGVIIFILIILGLVYLRL